MTSFAHGTRCDNEDHFGLTCDEHMRGPDAAIPFHQPVSAPRDADLSALAANRQMPDNARLTITLGELRAALRAEIAALPAPRETAAAPRIDDVQQELADAVIEWWEAHRPQNWNDEQHRENPAVNVGSSADENLAYAAARLSAARLSGESR